MKKIFISHSTEEKELARPFAEWLEKVLRDVKAFCSSRPGEIAGQEWRDRVTAEAKENDLYISLMSPESRLNPWIQYEAGLACAGPKSRLVPVIYGGLTKKGVPTTLTNWQILDFGNKQDFDGTLAQLFREDYDRGKSPTMKSFLDSCDCSVKRMITYGPLATWLKGGIRTKRQSSISFQNGKYDEVFFQVHEGEMRISSLRMKIRPMPVGTYSQWKCGISLGQKQESKDSRRELVIFHSGCHKGVMSFCFYPEYTENPVPVNIPADLGQNKIHSIQLWVGPNFREIIVVGIDASDQYYKITTDGKDPIWRPSALDECDSVMIHAWADGRPFRVIIEDFEIDYCERIKQT